jgi:hypothetical protein
MRLRLLARLLLIASAVTGGVWVVSGADEVSATLFAMGAAGFAVLALASFIDRGWFGR